MQLIHCQADAIQSDAAFFPHEGVTVRYLLQSGRSRSISVPGYEIYPGFAKLLKMFLVVGRSQRHHPPYSRSTNGISFLN